MPEQMTHYFTEEESLGLMVCLTGQLQHPNTLLQACFIIHICCLINKIIQLWKQQRLKEHVYGSAGKVCT